MLIDLQQTIGRYFHDVFVNNVDWWVLLGVVAQGLFTMRFVVQWWASEKAGRSVVPMTFWWFSIGGGALLLMYALYRRDPVFILGQGFGVFVYVRNLQFVLRARARGEDTNSGPG
ncbi:lipid-A-disaccharide synthase N-terminal domain-containing protein [Bosea sp. (in: a-proteobacteria)]|uniref:lipid-A-disaccharide synthase N-terminal domain-containing protein n=1 Tax=Bosea sp. (in: a-proteobacteria) TaxID=1871050 RepID=UPI00260B4781|nr:lipid-A-disaccharide synthase N-terminal domain-containing protein [Bosea sp. (in: a-proteobacteria)]MCO5092187.1 lipid-A-disaccharide synthase N-terminal domain-containing protein [Bosea sp. (in: a-proteobacteria)]